jgi:F-type H+-transporting ATPase subunit a
MPEQLWFTAILNKAFAGPVDGLLQAIHLPPANPQAPISDAFAMELLVVGFLILLFAIVRTQFSVDNPGGLQHVFELADGFITGQSKEIIGAHSEGYTPFLLTLFFFILIGNLIGLIPGFSAPTATPVVPLGCAILAFLYYHAQGIRRSGPAYFKHFLGPIWWLAWLMLPIEIISHLARVLSLTIRLYANMFAGDMVTLGFFSLIPIGLPIAFLAFHIGVSILQTYIFVILTTVYLASAVAEEH